MKAQKNIISRRHIMATAAVTAATITSAQPEEKKKLFKIKNGRIRQSIMGWCFNPMPTMELAKHCKEIGLVAMEGIDSKHYPAVRELGLKISLVSGGHGFRNGPCNPKNTETVINGIKKGIDLAADIGTKSVITFTGMTYKDMDPDKAADLCVETWKKVMPHAEKKGITLVLEHLNSRDDSHPMKGHPGYFGDDVDFCAKLVNGVGSKNFKLLFDVYHVQVMNGDVIRRIKQYKDIIGHYHTAGCPGRGEIDETQEINYPPILKAILETGYEGYLAQEFIPTWKDPIQSLRHAAEVCDI
ncbi:TIM barrel protein [Verrucomicrobiales bacterium]|nr:TIM barrel protein [Verrucomicrobiales bacterium]MDC0049046.1 TIM barrel protein [Verrucomicrobiota bacterium]